MVRHLSTSQNVHEEFTIFSWFYPQLPELLMLILFSWFYPQLPELLLLILFSWFYPQLPELLMLILFSWFYPQLPELLMLILFSWFYPQLPELLLLILFSWFYPQLPELLMLILFSWCYPNFLSYLCWFYLAGVIPTSWVTYLILFVDSCFIHSNNYIVSRWNIETTITCASINFASHSHYDKKKSTIN